MERYLLGSPRCAQGCLSRCPAMRGRNLMCIESEQLLKGLPPGGSDAQNHPPSASLRARLSFGCLHVVRFILSGSSSWRRTCRKAKASREMKAAASSRLAFDPDAPVHHFHKLGRDRQAKTCSPVFASGRTIGLRESLEDDLLLVLRNSD